MKTGQYTVAAIVATIASHGCLDPLAPDVGAPLQGPCRNEDSDPATAVLYNTDIAQGIWQAAAGHCNNCHFPTAANPIGISTDRAIKPCGLAAFAPQPTSLCPASPATASCYKKSKARLLVHACHRTHHHSLLPTYNACMTG